MDRQFLSHPCYLTQDRIKLHVFNAFAVKEVTYIRRQVTLVFTAVTSKNDATLCKLDVIVKNRTAIAGSGDFSKLKLKPLKRKKCYFTASSTFKIKYGKSKGMQEKVSIMGIWCG